MNLPKLPSLPMLPALPMLPTLSPIVQPARVMVVDWPWNFDDKLGKRGAEANYKTLTLDDAKAWQLPPLADDCVLFFWRVSAMIEEAYQVIRAWNFTPKSEITWLKTKPCDLCDGEGYTSGRELAEGVAERLWCLNCQGHGYRLHFGMGRYTRHATETCIIATRGSCQPTNHATLDLFVAPRPKAHSQKPKRFYEKVKTMYPVGPYVELFARVKRDGWMQFGDQLGSLDDDEAGDDDAGTEKMNA